MYTGLATIIVEKLQQAGFSAIEGGSGVYVSLSRDISTLEVMAALDQAFAQWGHNFKVRQIASNKVIVEE